MLDSTRGYGHIIELEKLIGGREKEETIRLLKGKLESLGIPLTKKKVFDQKYAYYQDHRKEFL